MAALAGKVVDLRQHAGEVVRAACWAPSHHNAQPWKFRVTPAEVEVWADRGRRIPLADPEDRQLFIGVGAAVFGVRLAVNHLGAGTTVRLARDPARPDLAAVVSAAGVRAAKPEEDRLLAELSRRRTARGPFTDDAVPLPVQVSLTESVRDEGARLEWVVREGPRRDLAALIMAAELAQQSNADFRAELDRWVGAIATSTGSGIPLANTGTTLSAGRRGEFPLRDFAADQPGLAQRPEANPGIAVLCTPGDQRADWLRSGQALHRLLLVASAAGVSASFLNQPLEIPWLRARISEDLQHSGYPQVILRLGRPAGPLPPPTPRRPVSSVLLGQAGS
jgi:hypothetical protein